MNLKAINSAFKYPSIETYHKHGERGRLTEELNGPTPDEPLRVFEKIDGVNARIILPAGGFDWLIGSREELLTAAGDRVWPTTKSMEGAILETLLPRVRNIAAEHKGALAKNWVCIYGEVFGHKWTPKWKDYGDGIPGFRVFDIAVLTPQKVGIFDCRPEDIAMWRDQGKQPFAPAAEFYQLIQDYRLVDAEWICNVEKGALPTSIELTKDWLSNIFTKNGHGTEAVEGMWEGAVVRTDDRSWIRKIRFEDYERTMKAREREAKK